MDKNEVMVFSNELFGDVRTLIGDNGEPLFCGIDITNALGYSNSTKAIADHCPSLTKRYAGVETGVKADGTPSIQYREMSFIPESDVYRLIIRSTKPEAVKFEKWVMEEVTPSIRKHGAHMTPETPEKVMLTSNLMMPVFTMRFQLIVHP